MTENGLNVCKMTEIDRFDVVKKWANILAHFWTFLDILGQFLHFFGQIIEKCTLLDYFIAKKSKEIGKIEPKPKTTNLTPKMP